MAETLDMTLDDIIKNNKKNNPSGGGRRSRGGSASGGSGGGGGVGPTRRPFKRAGNRQAPYQPPKVRTNRTGLWLRVARRRMRGFRLR
jgi:THO complex subunit 4